MRRVLKTLTTTLRFDPAEHALLTRVAKANGYDSPDRFVAALLDRIVSGLNSDECRWVAVAFGPDDYSEVLAYCDGNSEAVPDLADVFVQDGADRLRR